MNSEILDIWETNNDALLSTGIVTDNNYIKLFCLDIKYHDGIRECIYLGWTDRDNYVPYFEGYSLDHYDVFLMTRIEKFAWRYRELILKGTDIMDVIKADTENILGISIEKSNRQFIKKIFQNKKETN